LNQPLCFNASPLIMFIYLNNPINFVCSSIFAIHSPSANRVSLIISQIDIDWFMHKLNKLAKIIEERIGSLMEEVEIATNVKLNSLYIIDRKDEIEFLYWTMRIIYWVLDRAHDKQEQQQLGVAKMHLELEDTKKFENMLHDKIQELEIELEDSDAPREKEVLVNEIETLECVLGHLDNLKAGDEGDGDKAGNDDQTRAIEIAV
jgi:hypothetical protein